MAKIKSLEDSPRGEAGLPPVSETAAPAPLTASERREEKEILIQDKDIEAIDKIILSDDLQKGGVIRIERRGPTEQNFSFVCRLPAEQWKDTNDRIEWCKNMFGGGEYQCRTFRANGQMYRMFTFDIDPRYQGKLDKDEIARMNGEKGDKGDVMAKLLEVMSPKSNDGLRLSDVMNILDRQQNKGESTMAMLMTMMMKSMEVSAQNNQATMTALMTVMAGKQGGDNQSLLLELIKQKQERTPMMETLEMMKQIKDIFENNGKEEKDDMWSKLGRIAGPVLAGIAAGGQPKPAATVAGQPPPASLPASRGGQGGPAKTPTIAGQPPGLIYQLPLQYQIMFKLGLAAEERGSDPGLYYDIIVDQMGDDGIKSFQQHLTGDDWCVKLFGSEAQVAHIRPWLDELRKMIMEHNANPAPPEPPAGGDSTPAGQPTA